MPQVDYETGEKISSTERAIASLIHIGPSVVSGGFTTFLGIVCLAFSKSTVFRIFFKMFCLIIGFGLSYGIFVIPVILIWLDLKIPESSSKQLKEREQRHSNKKQQSSSIAKEKEEA